MKFSVGCVFSAASFLAMVVAVLSSPRPNILKTTDERIRDYGYPVEEHTVVTSDGYILTLYRIPYSPKLQNMNDTKPVAFLQHGFLYSSDCWITNGPKDALAYLYVDAGYDVWLANSRGNVYSKMHTSLSSNDSRYWDFSWHEIALFDLPACIDYILKITRQSALHYVGHSQGTTVFFVLLSTDPSYNNKIKVGYMLAPVTYTNHMKSPLVAALAPFLGYPSILSRLFGVNEFLPSNQLLQLVGSNVCSEELPFQQLCLIPYFLASGFDYRYFNYSMLPDIRETFSVGASAKQAVHFIQEYRSGHFRQYDYGLVSNLLTYNQTSPPDYEIEQITAKVVLYYGANDWFSDVIDVERLKARLPNLFKATLMPYPEWNHFDFVWSILVKNDLYDKIIKTSNDIEAKERV